MENKPMISETEKREALKQFMAEKAKAPVCVAFSGGILLPRRHPQNTG